MVSPRWHLSRELKVVRGASCRYLRKECSSQREELVLRLLRWSEPGMVKKELRGLVQPQR